MENNKTVDYNLPFRPVIGTNEQILKQSPTKGYLWFATDSKKIYYSDGDAFLSMGGNTGIYYGIKQIPEDTPSDEKQFNFTVNELDENQGIESKDYKIPNPNDLILNIPNGIFYRVNDIVIENDEVLIQTIKLTVAGSGGSGGNSSAYYRLSLSDVAGYTTKYFTLNDNADALKLQFSVQMNPNNAVEENGIYKIVYNLGKLGQIEDLTYRKFGEIIEFDLEPYLSKFSSSVTNTISIQVTDIFGYKTDWFKYYINIIDLNLTSTAAPSGIITSGTQNFQYTCKPSGGSTLINKQIKVTFYDENGSYINNADIIKSFTITDDIPIDIVLPEAGVYTMNVAYEGWTNEGASSRKISSNILSYQVVYYGENPQLIVNAPKTKIEQYSSLTLTYMIAMATDSIEPLEILLINGDNIKPQQITYNNINEWSIYFDTIGIYSLIIRSEQLKLEKIIENIEVIPYSGDIPTITTEGLTLSLSPVNRSNSEVNKDVWTYTNQLLNKTYECEFSNFTWGNVNGWLKDDNNVDILRLSSGAKLELIDLFPYEMINGRSPMEMGQTLELDFKFSGVTDFTKPLISCLSYSGEKIEVGFQITGQESTLNTAQIKTTGAIISEEDTEEAQKNNTKIQGLTARFIEDDRIRLTWVVESKNSSDYPMIFTYLNGIVSGITQYNKDDSLTQNSNSKATIKFDSTYGNIDIYNIRFYQQLALSDTRVLNNYIATLDSPDEKSKRYKDNVSLLNSNNEISIQNIETLSEYKLSVPYIKITGGAALSKDDNGYTLNSSKHGEQLPDAKKDYRLINKYEFIDPSGKRPNQTIISNFNNNGYLNGLAMYGQGTSSMEYPVKNLRIKAKMKDENGNKVKFPLDDIKVDLICLKADYMESSGSHNTGTGNLIYNLTTEMSNMKTPGQEYWSDKVGYEIVTAIKGFPVLVFYRSNEDAEDESAFEFVGKYNYNLDKATHEPFGFIHDKNSNFGWDPSQYKEVSFLNEKDYLNYPFDIYYLNDDNEYIKSTEYDVNETYYSIYNKIHCYEFLNNSSPLTKFLSGEGKTFEDTFYGTVNSKDGEVPNWFTAYESRYPEFEKYKSVDVKSWYRLCSWVNSTATTEATNNLLDNEYEGLDGIKYTIDSAEYRLAKFKKEFHQYFNFNFTCFYYILTNVLLMIDSRAKNMMIATWDEQIWYPIFYDMDTMLGLNNYGYNKYYYDVEDTTPNVYNGQDSVLWNNFRTCFSSEISAFYQTMQNAGLNYNKIINNYNDNQANAVNETVFNKDSKYKYQRPFSEGYLDSSENEDAGIVEPGARDYLYASQGDRSLHRKWWTKNRINFFNGKHLSSAFQSDRYTLRIYTPQEEGDNYYAKPNLQAFEPGETYYKMEIIYVDGIATYDFIEVPQGTNFDPSITYYVKDSGKIKESLKVVPANNNFTLTPLSNQYLSVAFGGYENGDIVGPALAKANTSIEILAPFGTKYTDTETYLSGGSLLKDLGDLSSQYIGRFEFPSGKTKLEKLTLGNFSNKYYNPNFAALKIGTSAPYLKELNIVNCIGLKNTPQDVSYCQNLQKLYATGSGITSCSLPQNGVLNEVRLPDSISSLTIINQPYLTSDNFTIGSCDYDDSTGVKNYKEASVYNLSRIRIEDTPINSYELIRKTDKDILSQFYLKNVNWTIKDKDEILENGKVNVLEKLLNATPYEDLNLTAHSQALTGTIKFDASLGLTETEALQIYERYSFEPKDNTKKYFPNVIFEFEGLNIYDVNIYDGQGRLLWTRKTIGSINNIPIYFTRDFLATGPMGELNVPESYNTIDKIYTFNGFWKIGDQSYKGDVNGYPIFNEGILIIDNINIMADYSIETRKYNITFMNGNDIVKNSTENYGSFIKDLLPLTNPYKDDLELPLTETYVFKGYNVDNNSTEVLDFTNVTLTGDVVYYAIFEQMSVYDNINEEYFKFTKQSYNSSYFINKTTFQDNDPSFYCEGYVVELNLEKDLKGKITIPATYNKLPVWGITTSLYNTSHNNSSITHIFVEQKDNISNLRMIGDSAFYGYRALQYFDFPKKGLRMIGDRAFRESNLKPNYGLNGYYFGDDLFSIEHQAFNQAFDLTNLTEMNFFFSNALTYVQSWAFCHFSQSESVSVNITVGNEDGNQSQLDFSKLYTGSIPYSWFKPNSNIIQNVDFYTSNYNSWDNEISLNNGKIKQSLHASLGSIRKEKELKGVWTLYNKKEGIIDERSDFSEQQ